MSIKNKVLVCAALGLALWVSSPTSAQQIQAKVSMILERLPLEKQDKLVGFAQEIEQYINTFDWTGEPLEEPVKVTIQIFLNDKSVSYEDRYSGTFLISNNVDLQYYDKYWLFPYQKGDALEHSEVYHPLTSFIDFYIYIIIANEYDKFDRFLGTPYFEKVRQIGEQGQFDNRYVMGWRERTQLVEYLFGDEFKKYREMKDAFYLGLAYIQDEAVGDGLASCRNALDLLDEILKENPDNKEATQFIQGHHLEFLELFQGDKEVIKRLIAMDPDREDVYRQKL